MARIPAVSCKHACLSVTVPRIHCVHKTERPCRQTALNATPEVAQPAAPSPADAGDSGASEAALTEPAVTLTKLQAVDKVLSVRVRFDMDGKPQVEYLARWKADREMTWEPSENLSEDLLRDFEEAFWEACKAANMKVLDPALRYGGVTAANLLDENSRAPLHIAAAVNQVSLIKRLLDAGADVNVQDRDGYTPLHMAVGYLHTDASKALLARGADIQIQDVQGRDVTSLLDSLREQLSTAAALNQRLRLEEVSKALTYFTYEDVAPAAVLASRETVLGEQFLVAWRDGEEDAWVPAEAVSQEVIDDFKAGLEYSEAKELLESRSNGDVREYLVRWQDEHEDSWESEDNITRSLIVEFERGSQSDAGGGDVNGNGNGAQLPPSATQSNEKELNAPAISR